MRDTAGSQSGRGVWTKRNVIFVTVSLVVSGALLCAVFSLGQSGTPSPKLRIVRRGLEKGRPVVFCSVEGGGGRRMMIRSVDQLVGEMRETPVFASPGFLPYEPGRERLEFGVLTPTNGPVWKLQVTVSVEVASLLDRIKNYPAGWRACRGNPNFSTLKAPWVAWTIFYGDVKRRKYVLESESITNRGPPY